MTECIWPTFFLSTFAQVAEPFAVVLQSWGCREAWLQGEFFRLGRDVGLHVNRFPLGKGELADLSASGPPPMVAELKVIGADHQPKMRHAIDADVARLRLVPGDEVERYMILVVPRCDQQGVLARYLGECSHGAECWEQDYGAFRVRIWRVAAASLG